MEIQKVGRSRVLQKTQNLVISRLCFVEDGKEMYKDVQRTCTAIALLIFKNLNDWPPAPWETVSFVSPRPSMFAEVNIGDREETKLTVSQGASQ